MNVISQNNAITSENIFLFWHAPRCHKVVLTTPSLAFHKSYGDISSEKPHSLYPGFDKNWNMACQPQIRFWNVSPWEGDNRNKDQMHVPLHLWQPAVSSRATLVRRIAIWPLGKVRGDAECDATWKHAADVLLAGLELRDAVRQWPGISSKLESEGLGVGAACHRAGKIEATCHPQATTVAQTETMKRSGASRIFPSSPPPLSPPPPPSSSYFFFF